MSLQTDKRDFSERTTDGLGNPFMRSAVSLAQDSLKTRRLSAAASLGDWEQWRTLGQQIRQHTLKHLDYYLAQLADNIEKKSGHIYFAKTKEEASSYIRDIIVQKKAKKSSNPNQWSPRKLS